MSIPIVHLSDYEIFRNKLVPDNYLIYVSTDGYYAESGGGRDYHYKWCVIDVNGKEIFSISTYCELHLLDGKIITPHVHMAIDTNGLYFPKYEYCNLKHENGSFSKEVPPNEDEYLLKTNKTLLQKAMAYASKELLYLTDRQNEPIINHLIKIMLKCSTIEEKIIGLLHHCSNLCLKRLEQTLRNDFGDELFDNLVIIKENDYERFDEDYWSYLEKVKKIEVLRKVKIFDLEDNFNINVGREIDDYELKRLDKFRDYLKYLMN